MIQLRCPCGALYQVPDDWAGQLRRCRECGADSIVPPAGTKVPIKKPRGINPEDYATEVSYVIQARKVLGWSQAHLARAAGIDQPTLARIESGERRMSDAVAARVEAIFANAVALGAPPPGAPDYRRTCNRCGHVRIWTVPICPECGCPEFSVPREARP